MKHHLTFVGKARDRPSLGWKGSLEVSSPITCLKEVLLEKVVQALSSQYFTNFRDRVHSLFQSLF